MHAPAPVAVVADAPRAGVLLKPLRLTILAEAHQPRSSTAIAARLGLPRQRVNYHVRALHRAGFLRRAGRARKRGLTEQKYVVTARAFLLDEQVLGPVSGAHAPSADPTTVAYLMTLGARMQREAGAAWREAQPAGRRVPVLSLDTTFAFESSQSRARFADALTRTVAMLVAQHTVPAKSGSRAYRLVLGCYPLAKDQR